MCILKKFERTECEGLKNIVLNDKNMCMRFIGAKVTYFRTMRGLTQRSLAERINVSPNTIGRIERGQYNDNVSISMLIDLANGLGVPVYAFLRYTEDDEYLMKELEPYCQTEEKASQGQDKEKHGDERSRPHEHDSN